MEKVDYHGWSNSIRMANEKLELIVTTDVGPRIIYLGLSNGRNLFANVSEEIGNTKDDGWHIYGGHRFWHGPESLPRTYYPDNHPVTVEQNESFVRFIQPVETSTQMQKELDIAVHAEQASVTITHRLRNHNLWPVECAPWALSVMDVGGTAVLPLPPRGPHSGNLLPNTTLNLWAYTNMQDGRWVWGEKYILLRQEPGNPLSQKVGAFVPAGWAAYVNHSQLFVKTFAVQPGAIYPDNQSNVELFTCDFMLEVESLGPLVNLAPGATVEHVEQWHLFDNVPIPHSDSDVDTHILPKIQTVQ